VNYRKPDVDDLSIRRIEVEEIAVLAAGLLERGR